MTNAKIVYASMTGNNEEVANIVDEELQNMGIETDISDVTISDASEYHDFDILFMIPYTYGEGEMPDEIKDFYDDLLQEDLTGKVFGVAGSGDVFYEDHYCETADDFQEALIKVGGIKATEVLKINLAPDAEDITNIENFVKQVVDKYNE